MAKRMAVFSVTPTIDPLRTHLETTKGCLFDFTEHLRLVRHVVEKLLICPDCMKDIGDYHGKSFASNVKKWVEGRKLSVPRPA